MLVTRNMDVQSITMKKVEGLPIQGEVTLKPLMVGDKMIMLEIHYPPGSGSPVHTHNHESVCYVVKGKVKVVVEQVEYTLGPGDACIHPKGVPHGIESLEDAVILEIKSPPLPLEQFLGID